MKTAVRTKLKNRHMRTVKVQVLKQKGHRLHSGAFLLTCFTSFKSTCMHLKAAARLRGCQIQVDVGPFDSSTVPACTVGSKKYSNIFRFCTHCCVADLI